MDYFYLLIIIPFINYLFLRPIFGGFVSFIFFIVMKEYPTIYIYLYIIHIYYLFLCYIINLSTIHGEMHLGIFLNKIHFIEDDFIDFSFIQ